MKKKISKKNMKNVRGGDRTLASTNSSARHADAKGERIFIQIVLPAASKVAL